MFSSVPVTCGYRPASLTRDIEGATRRGGRYKEKDMTDSLTLDIRDLTPAQVAQLLETIRSMRKVAGPAEHGPEDESWRDAPSTGWTLDLVLVLRENLRRRGNVVQLEAFNQAIRNGGEVSREEIFRIGGYDPKRQLKNWTKPLRTVTSNLIERGSLPEYAEFPMEADYTEGSGYRQARLFRVTPEIVKLVKEAMCDDCWKLVDTGPAGRKITPHARLEPVGDIRHFGGSMVADEQDYRCAECGKEWMHETGNSGMGWVETSH